MNVRNLYIILNKKDAVNLPFKAENVFCRSEFIKQFIKKDLNNLITPNPSKTSNESRDLFKKENQLTELIIEKSKNLFNHSVKFSLEELIKPYVSLRISSYLYIKSVIPFSDNYFIFNKGRWLCLRDKENLIIEIENKLSKEKDLSHFLLKECITKKYSWIDTILGHIQNLLLNIYLKKVKKIYFLTIKEGYFINHLTDILKKDKRDILYPYLGTNRLKYLYCIINLITYFFTKKPLYAGVFIIPKNFLSDFKFESSINKVINTSNIISKKYAKILSQDLNTYISSTISYFYYIRSIFKYINIDLRVISHSKRFPKTFALTEALEDIGHKNYLISHGSHTYQTGNDINKKAADQLALGMLYSNNKNTVLCSQSLFADQYLENENRNYVKINPIEKILISQNKINKYSNYDKTKLRILHAGTVKPMGIKRYLYHSSSEYIYNLVNICQKLKVMRKDIQFIIRIRPVLNEVNINYLKEVLSEFSDFVVFSKTKSFMNELLNIDCLMALSSTTLEQAINNNIPSLSIGETGYDHLSYYKNNNLPVTYKKYDNFLKVEKLIGKKFIYFSIFERDNAVELSSLLK